MTKDDCSTPLVSVSMITYNHREYVKKAVDSILNQLVEFPFELVIGDDCSTDGTGEIVKSLARQYPDQIRLVTSAKNVGARENCARVERACRGEYLAYCEGDDFWHDRRKLAKQVAFLTDRPDYSFVHSHCDRYFVDTGKTLRNDLKVPTDLDDANGYEDLLCARRFALTVTILARTKNVLRVLDEAPECTDPVWPMGDTQRWLELARLGKVGCIHEPLATTCILAESAGQSRDPGKKLKFYLAARRLKLHYLKKYPVSEALDLAVRQQLALSILYYAFLANDHAVADEMFTEYSSLNGQMRLRSRWMWWGSVTPRRRKMVTPLLKLQSRMGLGIGGGGRQFSIPFLGASRGKAKTLSS